MILDFEDKVFFACMIFFLIGVFGFIYLAYCADLEEDELMMRKCSPDYHTFECQLYLSRRKVIYVGN